MKEILTNDEVLTYFGISKRTLTTWRLKKLIAYSQIGAKIYYTKADIDEFLASYKKPLKTK